MPYIPRYPNKQEIANVLSWPNAKRGPAWSVTSHVKEAPEEVINFYKGALKQNKWELLNGRNTDKMLSARRGKALFNVMVMQPVLKGYRSQVYMTYKIYGPPGE